MSIFLNFYCCTNLINGFDQFITNFLYSILVSIQHKDEDENKEVEPLKSPKKEKHKSVKPNPPGKIEDRSFPQVAFSVDKDILIEIEELEEKMFSASLQNKVLF